MRLPSRLTLLRTLAAAALLACRPAGGGQPAELRIAATMADPRGIPDDRGEWILVRNAGRAAASLRGWTLASGGDRPHRIDADVPVPAGGTVLLGRTADARGPAGERPAYAWGSGLALGNRQDWVALRAPGGGTVDSVAWGGGAARAASPSPAPPSAPAPATGPVRLPSAAARAPLVVKVLDVGQGDAILVENGGSRALVDGGVDPAVLGRHLDALGLDAGTIDVVVVTHPHLDHYNGLRELFRSRRRMTVRYLFEAKDRSPNRTMNELRDSIAARARRRELEWRDADDPCGDGRAGCTVTLRGGARLTVLRPFPDDTAAPNNRSVAVRLESADSSFAMWLAGDAEREAMAWMERSGYPMRAQVLKANHHGSCDGISRSYLARVRPQLAVLSLASPNDYGYVHAQTARALEQARVPWLRTDVNGTVTITAPGRAGAFDVAVERGGRSARGPSDRVSRDDKCRDP